MTRALLIRFVSIAGCSVSFYLMLSVVPLYARAGGASANTAGLATTALSLSTVAGYLPTPRLVARYGHRLVLGAGMLLLGAPALVLTVWSSLAVIMAVCVVRGISFAITCVSGGALTVSLIPAGRRGGGLALVGVVTGAASVAALPLGVWLAGQAGFRPVFLIAALAALAPVVTMPWLPPGGQAGGLPSGQASTRRSTGIVAGLRTPALIRPAMMFFATTMATGIFVTFLPLTATRATADTAALALLIQPLASIGGRCLAGWAGDRRGAASPGEPASTLLVPGMLLTAAGLALLSLTAVPAAVLAGAALFGAGFGIAQNTTLTLMYDRVPQEAYSMVSALWNLAYDTGMGVGAAGFGVLAAGTGYPAAFLLTASVVVLAVGLNRRTKEH